MNRFLILLLMLPLVLFLCHRLFGRSKKSDELLMMKPNGGEDLYWRYIHGINTKKTSLSLGEGHILRLSELTGNLSTGISHFYSQYQSLDSLAELRESLSLLDADDVYQLINSTYDILLKISLKEENRNVRFLLDRVSDTDVAYFISSSDTLLGLYDTFIEQQLIYIKKNESDFAS